MKHFALAIALACALSGSAFAGDAHSVGAPAPGEIPTVPIASEPGEIPTVNSKAPSEAPGMELSALLALVSLAF